MYGKQQICLAVFTVLSKTLTAMMLYLVVLNECVFCYCSYQGCHTANFAASAHALRMVVRSVPSSTAVIVNWSMLLFAAVAVAAVII